MNARDSVVTFVILFGIVIQQCLYLDIYLRRSNHMFWYIVHERKDLSCTKKNSLHTRKTYPCTLSIKTQLH